MVDITQNTDEIGRGDVEIVGNVISQISLNATISESIAADILKASSNLLYGDIEGIAEDGPK